MAQKKYDMDFEYKLPEYGAVTVLADDMDEAEDLAIQHVKDTFADATDIEITGRRERI